MRVRVMIRKLKNRFPPDAKSRACTVGMCASRKLVGTCSVRASRPCRVRRASAAVVISSCRLAESASSGHLPTRRFHAKKAIRFQGVVPGVQGAEWWQEGHSVRCEATGGLGSQPGRNQGARQAQEVALSATGAHITRERTSLVRFPNILDHVGAPRPIPPTPECRLIIAFKYALRVGIAHVNAAPLQNVDDRLR